MGARTRGFANNVLTSGKLDATDGLTGNLASTNFANATVTNIEELPPAVGSAISSVAGNPAAPVAEGKIWYNTNTDSFNVAANLEAWSSSAPLTTARTYAGSTGIQTAAMTFGGYTPSKIATTEEYNGTGFNTGGSMNTATRSQGSAGTLTAGLSIAGNTNLTKVEEYDGTSWSEVNDVPAGIENNAGLGIQTAALSFGGGNNGANSTTNLEYDGTNWTSGGSLNTPRSHSEGAGTQTAGLAFTGDPGFSSGGASATESYDGSSWTTLANVNTARTDAAGGGSQNDAIVFGGRSSAPTNTQATEKWDGTSWSTSPATMANTSSNGIGCANQPGTASANISMGGSASNGGSQVTTTEEYNVSLNVITGAAWASGGSLSTARRGLGSGKNSQTLTAGLVFGGGGSPYGPIGIATEEYDGSSFSGGGNMNTPRYLLGGAGTQTSALGAGGYSYPPPASIDAVEEYDGSTWTNVSSLPQIRQDMSSFGTQTAAILASGRNRPGSVTYSTTLSYNGTSWTALGSPANVNTARIALSGSGTQTAGLTTGGNSSPYKQTEEWNGSTWTTQNSSINEHKNVNSSQLGIQTNALICGGGPSPTTATEGYDGTSWSTRPNMATGRYGSAGGGSATSGFIAGGFTTANTAATEEFTGETSALNVESLTTS